MLKVRGWIPVFPSFGWLVCSMEIKSVEKLNPSFFKHLKRFSNFSGTPPENSYLRYAGEKQLDGEIGKVRGWNTLLRFYFFTVLHFP